MIKVPTLFIRNTETHKLTDVPTPQCEWVFNGEGTATEKIDGAACLYRPTPDDENEVPQPPRWHKRYTLRDGVKAPADWIPATPGDSDGPGWVEVDQNDRWHNQAIGPIVGVIILGTYELVGPKVQKNPYKLTEHQLWKHGERELGDVGDLSLAGLEQYLRDLSEADNAIEGIVWHHLDGRMAKIKARDFGIAWPVE